MKKTILVLMALMVLGVTGIFMAPGHASGSTDADAKALFEEKCSICHSTENATDITDTPEGWRSTLTRMRDENGCPLNPEEFETIISYLSRNYGR